MVNKSTPSKIPRNPKGNSANDFVLESPTLLDRWVVKEVTELPKQKTTCVVVANNVVRRSSKIPLLVRDGATVTATDYLQRRFNLSPARRNSEPFTGSQRRKPSRIPRWIGFLTWNQRSSDLPKSHVLVDKTNMNVNVNMNMNTNTVVDSLFPREEANSKPISAVKPVQRPLLINGISASVESDPKFSPRKSSTSCLQPVLAERSAAIYSMLVRGATRSKDSASRQIDENGKTASRSLSDIRLLDAHNSTDALSPVLVQFNEPWPTVLPLPHCIASVTSQSKSVKQHDYQHSNATSKDRLQPKVLDALITERLEKFLAFPRLEENRCCP